MKLDAQPAGISNKKIQTRDIFHVASAFRLHAIARDFTGDATDGQDGQLRNQISVRTGGGGRGGRGGGSEDRRMQLSHD